MGRGGRMFYLGNDMVLQSAGLVMRDRAVAQLTDLLAQMNEELRARGIRFLVAPPPNASSVYTEDLPLRAQNAGRPTEYDLLMSNLAAKGVRAVDLRPVLKAARPGGSLFYMHDTHWSFRGALMAYNAIVDADSHPDWRLDPNSVLAPAVRKGGDMAKILGLPPTISENTEKLTLPYGRRIPLPDNDFIETFDKPGPKILILGNSLTLDFFLPCFYSTSEARSGCTTNIVALTGVLSTKFGLMKFGGCLASGFFSASTGPLDFPKRRRGPGKKKRPWVSAGRRKQWKIRRPFENEVAAKTASCSTPKAA